MLNCLNHSERKPTIKPELKTEILSDQAGSGKPEAGSRMQDAGGRKWEAGSSKQDIKIYNLKCL
jgi:hypothetical protein